MALLIDCYNLLHETMPPQLAGLNEDSLCRLLARSRWAGQIIRVVCDGRTKRGLAAVSPVEEVELVYSGPQHSADDLILQWIDADSAPRRLLVVSSDRQIQKAARRRRAQAVTSQQFIATLLDALGSSSGGGAGANRPQQLTSTQVDYWLATFGVKAEEMAQEARPAPRPVPRAAAAPPAATDDADDLEDQLGDADYWMSQFLP